MAKIIAALVGVTATVVVEHNGVRYGPGEEAGTDFEVTEAQARPLLDVSAVVLTPVEDAASDEAGDVPEPGAGTKASAKAKK